MRHRRSTPESPGYRRAPERPESPSRVRRPWQTGSERELGAWILAVGLLERRKGVAEAIGLAVRRHLHHQPDIEIARRTTLGVRRPATRNAQALSALAARRHL